MIDIGASSNDRLHTGVAEAPSMRLDTSAGPTCSDCPEDSGDTSGFQSMMGGRSYVSMSYGCISSSSRVDALVSKG